MSYTEEDVDNALANSLGPRWWAANGPGNSGFSRVIALMRAAEVRWFGGVPEDRDSEILREAWADLRDVGHFHFVEEEDQEEE